MEMRPATASGFDRKGTFYARLDEVQCYTEKNMQTDEPEPNLTFIFNLGDLDESGKDVMFFQGFVKVPTDGEGYPKLPGKRSRFYKILSALHGERFDPVGDPPKIDLGFPDEFNSPEGLLKMPSFKDYTAEEEHFALSHFTLNGEDIIGKECQLELDYPEKPDGSRGTRIAVVEATPLPKAPVRRTAGAKRPPVGAPA